MITNQRKIFDSATNAHKQTPFSDLIAIGTVVDTNDPMQLGRVRAVVPMWGDSWEHETDSMPWCMYVSPLAGQTHVGTKGPGIQHTVGGVAYGMWGIPKVGAQIVVMSLDESHIMRLNLGCIYDPLTSHTMPHGRWMYDDHPELNKEKPKCKPYGPYSSSEHLIQPLSANLQQAFGNNDVAYEWRTRAADYSVSRVDVSQLNQSYSKVQDDLEVQNKDNGTWSSTQGYQNSRIDPLGNQSGKNYDSHVYSWTTPGFHSISMDDRQENCRVRIRTTSGHQILMDDTNERVYISTAQGNNWIEMDQAGNICIYSNSKVSVRATADINLTSDKNVRIYGKAGVHIRSDADIRMSAVADIHMQAGKSIHEHAANDVLLQADKNVQIKAGTNVNLTSSSSTNIKSGAAMALSSSASLNLSASGNILQAGAQIHLNGPGPAAAKDAAGAGDLPAIFPNMVPDHEPWARTMTAKDTGVEPELKYADAKVGRSERGYTIPRGIYWRR